MPLVLFERQGSIATITLNRPERRNALSLEMMLELIECLNKTAVDAEISVVILAAAGKAFSSGHDLKEMTGVETAAHRRIFAVCTDLMTRIQTIPQPVIARVQGVATAAGCQLVASCDLAVAAEEATFATPGVKIGLFCTTPMVAVSRAVGRKRALELLLTGRAIGAATAAEWGLVNRVVPAERLMEEARTLAEEVARGSRFTIALGKQAYYAQIDLEQSKAYTYAQEVMTTNAQAQDAQEGMAAFLEKRPAVWVGR